MSDTTLLISGAAGFLGSHLVERGLKLGHRVIGIDNFCTGQKKNVALLEKMSADKFTFIEADAAQPWAGLAAKCPSGWLDSLETVFHFASPASPPLYQKLALETMWVNSLGLSEALSFADQHGGRVVFSSTSEVYGDPQVAVQDEEYRGWVNTVGPRSCYDESKRFGESLIHTHNLKKGTRHGFVRIFNTYGPRMNLTDGRVIINFLVQALKGEDLTVYGTGQQTRSFCYVDDLIDGIWRFAEQKDHVGPINLGNDHEFTILDLAQTVSRLFADRKLTVRHVAAVTDDPQRRLPSLALAQQILDWKPTVQLHAGLKRMIEWLEKEV